MLCLILIFATLFVTWPCNATGAEIKARFAEETGDCTLPPYPKNGVYTVEGNPTARPGEKVDSFVLKVTCDPGFQLVGARDTIRCKLGAISAFFPGCIPICQWIHPTILSCGNHTSPPVCYLQQTGGSTDTVTFLGQRYVDVDDVCGKVGSFSLQPLSGGKAALKQELPWHAGIYSKRYLPYMQICGGSLVSATVVISAAHCFWDDVRKQLPAEDYAVAVGKIYRPWNDSHDEMAQKSDVRKIHIPPRFLGSAANFQEDLALVVLTTPVHFTDAVRPVCLDFDYKFDTEQLTHGALGEVAGWGLREQDGRASPTLQMAYMPYIDIEACVANSDPSFRSYLTADKICAGYTNGTAVCKGDSGGGLTFLSKMGDEARYFLRGVVSAAPGSEHLCSVYHWATFTHLQRHQHFIQTHVGVNLQAGTLPPASTHSSMKTEQKAEFVNT